MINDNTLLQSAGLYSGSQIQIVQVNHSNSDKSSLVTHSTTLKTSYFGEGCTFLNKNVYQLTYREGKMLIYDSGLNNVATVSMPIEMAEGWGMTNDG